MRSLERSPAVPAVPRRRSLHPIWPILLVASACFSDAPQSTAPEMVVEMAPIHRNSSLNADEVRTILGPVTVTRGTGTPVTQTFSLDGFGPNATLRISNGDASGRNRVSSGTVSLDGMEVVSQSEFGNKVASIERAIVLRNPSTLAVRLTGTPGDRITILVDGTLATTAPASPAGGTVHLLGEQVALTVPPGAVASPVDITAAPAPAPDSAAIPGATIEFGPPGTTFAVPVTVAIAFDPAQLPAGAKASSLAMYFWNTDHWEAVPGSSVDLAHGVVSAQVSHFSLYALLPGDVEFCPSDAGAEHALGTAIAHVAPGGTVAVCNGTWTVPPVTINKPMTLRSLNTGGATLADSESGGNQNAGNPMITVNGISSGTVRFADIGISVTDQGIVPTGTFDQIVVDSSRFSGLAGGFVGVKVLQSTVAGAHVEVINSAFSDMVLGVWPLSAVETNLRRNTFDRFTGGAADYSSSNTPTTQSTGIIEDNIFTGCSTAGCIRILTGGGVIARRNTLNASNQPIGLAAIAVQTGPNSTMPGSPPIIIEDNIINSSLTGQPTNTPAGWQAQNGVLINDVNVRTNIVRRNTIVNAYAALQIQNGDVDMRDNVMTNGFIAFRQGGPNRTVTIERNDFTGLISSFTATNTGASFHCNWWGSAAGPTSPPVNPPGSTYAPWAVAPIAGTNNACSTTPGYPLVHVCSIDNGADITFSTAAQGVSFVSPGGTVKFCNETFPANAIAVNKPMTLTAEAGATPTIDAGTNLRALNIALVTGTGPVVVSKLRFINSTSQQINVGVSPGTVQITQNDFFPATTNATYGVSPGNKAGITVSGGTTSATVTIDHNTFTGGDIGINGAPAPLTSLTISNNTFAGTFNSHVSMGTLAAGPATGISISNNTMSDCGSFFCINTQQPASISLNQITSRMARRPSQWIQIQNPNNYPGTTLVIGNTMTGLDMGVGPRNLASTYPVSNAVGVFSGTATIAGNTITRAAFAVSSSTPAVVTVTDNVATTMQSPLTANLGIPGGSQLTANWNDFSDYPAAVGNPTAFNTSVLNIRCNWWSSLGGPINISGSIPTSAYTPFAGAAVAGGPHTGCVP